MKILFISIFLFAITTTQVHAQSQNLCQDGDCPTEVLAIKLDAPLEINSADMQNRTEQFKAAYLTVKSLKEKQTKIPGWSQKYTDWALVGASCVRFYQLEGKFAYEYEQNPAFKTFINQQEKDIRAFKKEGFESTKRAINLLTRMKSNCKKQIKKLDETPGPSTTDLLPVYKKIGEDLGYFDKDGNLKIPSPEEEKTAALSDKLAQIPLGSEAAKKLEQLGEGLNAGQKTLNGLLNTQGGISSQLSELLPKPLDLLSKLGNLGKAQNELKLVLSDKPSGSGLLGKLTQLMGDKDKLIKQVEAIANKPSALKVEADKLNDKIGVSKDHLSNQNTNLGNLKNKLADLAKKKGELEKLLKNPAKNLDGLEKLVNDLTQNSKNTEEDIKKGQQDKDDILSKIANLGKEQGDLLPKLKDLEDQLKALDMAKDQLENGTQEVDNEVGKSDPMQEAIAKLKEKLNGLNDAPDWKSELNECDSGLKILLKKINPFAKVQLGLKNKLTGFLSGPSNLIAKLASLKNVHDDLKTKANGLSQKESALKKIDKLISSYASLKTKTDQAGGEKAKLVNELTKVEKSLNDLTKGLHGDISNIAALQKEVDALIGEKSNLKSRLAKPIETLQTVEQKVNSFTERYGIFGRKKKCKDRGNKEAKADELEKEQKSLQSQVDDLERQIEALKKDQEQLAENTTQVSDEIDESALKESALKEQEEAIKEEFGTNVSLDPVPVEEWAESFEVQRPYWDAVFHPDDEVVEGMVGRYFEVKLKDAEKNVKLLFGPGKYFMEKNDFRSNYGSTIGAFVTEALHYMKKGDEGKVKLFVQGSADIAGHKTFRGKLDERYMYEEVAVLSQNADKETFASIAVEKVIPKINFDNTHLPDLRGNYLKEMIGRYSKKMKPILLEGEVKTFEGVGERNAVIYLFFPEELLAEYEEK